MLQSLQVISYSEDKHEIRRSCGTGCSSEAMDKLMSLTGLKKVKARKPKDWTAFTRLCKVQGFWKSVCFSFDCCAGKVLFCNCLMEATAVALYKSALQFQQMSPEIRKASLPATFVFACPEGKVMENQVCIVQVGFQLSTSETLQHASILFSNFCSSEPHGTCRNLRESDASPMHRPIRWR